MEKKRSLVIPLPRFEKKWVYETRFWLILGAFAASLLALYWWVALFPYLWVSGAYVEADSWRSTPYPGSHITALGPDVGDVVKRGDLLYSFDASWLVQKQEELEESVLILEEQIQLEKKEMDQAMEGYLAASQGAEAGDHRHLIALEEAQSRSEKAARDLESVKDELSSLELELKKMRVEAPFEGIVLARVGEVGTLTDQGQAIYTLIDPKKMWIRAQIPERYMALASRGAPVRIRLAAFSKREMRGTITGVDPRASQGWIGVKVALDDPHLPLKPGLTAQIALRVR